jgi:hypothetical protein
MGLTYEWKLVGLKKQHTNTLNDVIVGTQWRLTGTDEDGLSGVFTGATPFHIEEVSTGSFTQYSTLTEETVLSWIKEYVSGSRSTNYMNHINQMINREIDGKRYTKIDVSETDMPWSPTSGSSILPNGEVAPLA